MNKPNDDELLALLADMSESEIEQFINSLDEDERAVISRILANAPVWFPLEGPQMAAYTSDADIIATAVQQVGQDRLDYRLMSYCT